MREALTSQSRDCPMTMIGNLLDYLPSTPSPGLAQLTIFASSEAYSEFGLHVEGITWNRQRKVEYTGEPGGRKPQL